MGHPRELQPSDLLLERQEVTCESVDGASESVTSCTLDKSAC
jgi:hypothetical protein